MYYSAKQIPPENQESPLMEDITNMEGTWLDGLSFTGNPHFQSHVTPRIPGKKYKYRELHGSCQGDWQGLYYPADDWSDEAIKELEIEYFNTGSEWIVSGNESGKTMDASLYGDHFYLHECLDDKMREELSKQTGIPANKFVMLAFDGYTQTPKYREI